MSITYVRFVFCFDLFLSKEFKSCDLGDGKETLILLTFLPQVPNLTRHYYYYFTAFRVIPISVGQ